MPSVLEDLTIPPGMTETFPGMGHSRGNKFRLSWLLAAALACFVLAGWVPGARAEKGVLRATLDNGLRVVVIRNTLAPVVTTEINYLAGADEDLPGFRGMAHAHEHMMFRGSPGLSEDQLSTLISAMGGYFNADTSQTVTQYFFTLPASDIEIPLRIEAIRMRGILATSTLWGRERGAIEQEVARDLSDPEYVFYTRMLSKMFAGTPYRHDALGSLKSFNRLTAAMIKTFHEKWYAPNNAILVIVGDVDPAGTIQLVRKIFGHIARRPVPKRPAVRLRPLRPGKTMRLKSDLPNGTVYASYRLPGFDSPDFASGLILADVLDSRRADLYAMVPKGKALSADFEVEFMPRASIGIAAASFPKGGNGGALLEAVKAVIAGYLKKGFPEDLVEASKRHEIAEAEFGKNSVSGLASIWSQALAVEGRNTPEDDIAAIKKVTVRDVNRVAREYLENRTAITAILTPALSGKVSHGRGAPGGESFISKQAKPVVLPSWARKVFDLPKLPVSTIHPVVTTFPNGLRLIVQPEYISNTVSVYGRVKSNPALNVPQGKEGLDRILGGIFPYGAGKLDRIGLQKALDSIAANESAGTDFSLDVLDEYFSRAVSILSENLLHPALKRGPFRTVRKQTVATLAGLMQNPSYLSQRALYSGLYPKGDPSLRQATPGTAAAIHLSDLKAYYENTFRPDMTTIVVIGNITPEKAKTVIGKYFGRWKAPQGPKPVTDLPPAPLNRASSAVVPDGSRVQDDVTMEETLGITRKNPDFYALDLGSQLLAGGFYASRLYKDLREETGLVYTVHTVLGANNTRSVFGVLYGCDPANVSRASAIIRRDLQQMREEPVSEDELRQTKALVLRRLQISESNMGGIGQNLLNLSMLGLPLDEPERSASLYMKLTGEQIKSAFLKWVRPDDFVHVTLGPEPK